MKPEMNLNYQAALDYLQGAEIFGIKLGLERIRALLAALGHPERNFASVHITGTNGKGSVSAMTESILRRAGLKTGLYISPHLSDWRERIQINGAPISPADFTAALAAVRRAAENLIAVGQEPPTQFEILTAAAFWVFSEMNVDYAVVEVGLGGLYDSTNVITPKLSVITNVTLEHADKCGGTLAGVARHKAGIIKPGVPVVTAAEGMPLDIILATAQEQNSPCYVYGRDFTSTVQKFDSAGQEISFDATAFDLPPAVYEVPLLGKHQARNAAVALAAVRALGDGRLNPAAIKDGLRQTKWPGRFEIVRRSKTTLIFDGAHNPAGVAALRQTLDEYFPRAERLFVVGILHDKNIDAMLPLLFRSADEVIVTRPDSPRAAEPAELAAQVQKFCPAQAVDNPSAALQTALKRAADEQKLVIVCGSLYLIGAVRAEVIR